MKLIKDIKYLAKLLQNKQPKIFCIGKNKTGTTTLQKTMHMHGIRTGNQVRGELLMEDYALRDFKKIIRYCRSAQAFQDLPFSFPETYKHLDRAYPNSKFILTIRDSDTQWYNSLVKFHTQKFSSTNQPPTKEDLQAATYREPGFAWKVNRILHDTPEDDLYNEDLLKASYNEYNTKVKQYFKDRDNLLIINVSQEGDYQKLCKFLGFEPIMKTFPWENKTASLTS